MNQNRETILGRIREALKISAPHPSSHAAPGSGAGAGVTLESEIAQWMPPVGQTSEEQLELFGKNAAALTAELHVCADLAGAAAAVLALSREQGWKKIGLHAGKLTDPVASALGLAEVRTDAGYEIADLESCDAGLTECELLVAQTGSVLVSAPSAGGRALSVLPPHHVVLARLDQLVPDLTAAFTSIKARYGDSFPSFFSFITGPSRTGDIERILVLGAHGPKRLTILIIR